MLAKGRLLNQEAMKNPARMGIAMHHTELLRKLYKLAPDLIIGEGGIVGDRSIYRLRDGVPEFLVYTSTNDLPEFSIVHVNKDNQPIYEQRGWRTVLLRLIKYGVLTEAQVVKEFGEPGRPELAQRWNYHLFEFRNRERNTVNA